MKNSKYTNCPNCGGKIHFVVGLQKIQCEYCDSVFDPDELGRLIGAVEDTLPAEEDVTVFSCPSCGAQVVGEDVSAVEYCQYCGTFVTFNSRIEKIRRPDHIAPFMIDRQRCEEIYRDRIKSTLYVPRDLKNGEGKIEFHPMFIPFWNMEVEFPGNNKVYVSEKWREGSYDCSRNYEVEFESEGKLTNCLFDASKALDDYISDCIGDYEPDKLVEYNPSYMHGAYADMADVRSETYDEEAKERCFTTLTESVRNAFDDTGEGAKFHSHKSVSLSGEKKEVNPNVSSRLSMFPVWFMTYRNKDRVAYSVVNGQTGSIFTETPVDLVKFFIVSLLIAVPVFFILEATVTLRPTTMLGAISVITAVVIIMYAFIAGGEWERNNANQKNGEKKPALRFTKIIGGLFVFYIFAFAANLALWEETGLPMFIGIRIGTLMVALIAISNQYKKFDRQGRAMLIKETLPGLLAIIIAVVFEYYDPVFDWYFYVAAIIAMIGMIVSIALVVKRYNRRVTHPVPHFFGGKDGDIK